MKILRLDRERVAAIVVLAVIAVDLGWLFLAAPNDPNSTLVRMYAFGYAVFVGVPLIAVSAIGCLAATCLVRRTGSARDLAQAWAILAGMGAATMLLVLIYGKTFVSELEGVRATLPWASGVAVIGSVMVWVLLMGRSTPARGASADRTGSRNDAKRQGGDGATR